LNTVRDTIVPSGTRTKHTSPFSEPVTTSAVEPDFWTMYTSWILCRPNGLTGFADLRFTDVTNCMLVALPSLDQIVK
jgi:hypothetical protein